MAVFAALLCASTASAAHGTPRACIDSRAGRKAAVSAFPFSQLRGLMVENSAYRISQDAKGENAGYSDPSYQYDYYNKPRNRTTLVVVSRNDVVKTVAIGSVGDVIFSVSDPSGVLLGDNRACVTELAGKAVVASANELDYPEKPILSKPNYPIIFPDLVRFYNFDKGGRVQWIGLSHGNAVVPVKLARFRGEFLIRHQAA